MACADHSERQGSRQPRNERKPYGYWRKKFAAMKVGDTFLADKRTVTSLALHYSVLLGYFFRTRRIGEKDGKPILRVERVK
jgi:hypothetical protein